MSEPVHKLLRSLLMVWGPGATSAKRGPVWPGSILLSLSLSLSFSPFVSSLALAVPPLGSFVRWSGPKSGEDLVRPVRSALRRLISVFNGRREMATESSAPENQKEGLKRVRRDTKDPRRSFGTGCDWRPGVVPPTDILLLFKRRWIRGHVPAFPPSLLFFFFSFSSFFQLKIREIVEINYT